MSESKKKAEQPKVRPERRQQREPEPGPEYEVESTDFPVALPGQESVRSQAQLLRDKKFTVVKRQQIAAQIGRLGGNRYMQRLVAQMKRDEQAASREPPHTEERSPVTAETSQSGRREPAESSSALDGWMAAQQLAALPSFGPAIQRKDPWEEDPQQTIMPDAAYWQQVVGTVQPLALDAEQFSNKIYKYHEKEMELIGSVSKSTEKMVDNYDQAYEQHKTVIETSNQRIADAETTFNIAIGIACSAAVGLAGVAVGSLWAAYAAANSAVTVMLESTASGLLAPVVSVSLPRMKEAEPENEKARRWRLMAKLYKHQVDFMPLLKGTQKLERAATRVASDADDAREGGKGIWFKGALLQLKSASDTLMDKEGNVRSAWKQMDPHFSDDWKDLATMADVMKEQAAKSTVPEMEKNIWVNWVASLEGKEYDLATSLQAPEQAVPFPQLDDPVISRHLKKIGFYGAGGPLATSLTAGFGVESTKGSQRMVHYSAKSRQEVAQHMGKFAYVDDEGKYATAGGEKIPLFGVEYKSLASKNIVGPPSIKGGAPGLAGQKVMVSGLKSTQTASGTGWSREMRISWYATVTPVEQVGKKAP